MKPSMKYEINLWKKGFRFVAGIDEVGRGALAGPLVVSATIFPPSLLTRINRINYPLSEVRDSKQLTAKKRHLLSQEIKNQVTDFAIGLSTVKEINRLGIVKATFIAMRRAIKHLRAVDYVLVDAFSIPYLKHLGKKHQLGIKHGDQKCFSIAAASIVAKVYRDQLMVHLSTIFPNYNLDRHKGYGTLTHRTAIRQLGPLPIHRKLFVRNFI